MIRSLLKGHLLREANPGHPISNHNLHPILTPLTFFSAYLSLSYHHPHANTQLIYLVFCLFLLEPELHEGRVYFIPSSSPAPSTVPGRWRHSVFAE